MAVGLAGGAYWFWSTRKEEEKRQGEANKVLRANGAVGHAAARRAWADDERPGQVKGTPPCARPPPLMHCLPVSPPPPPPPPPPPAPPQTSLPLAAEAVERVGRHGEKVSAAEEEPTQQWLLRAALACAMALPLRCLMLLNER